MKATQHLRKSKTALKMLAVSALLTAGSFSAAQANSSVAPDTHKKCSSKSIRGTYGFQIEGSVPELNLILRTLSLAQFDGVNQLSGVDHVVRNGMPPPPEEEWRPSTGTYAVNANCTGWVSIDVGPGDPPLMYHFIIVNGGQKILLVVDGGAINGVGYRVD
jgi:hypothetical protein